MAQKPFMTEKPIIIVDKRGGHNRKAFNGVFLKSWTPQMAYVLGYAFADGSLINSEAARCCYLRFYSVDLDLLEEVKQVLATNVKIQTRKPQKIVSRGKTYWNKSCHVISVGSKALYTDLIRLGLKSDKSLDMVFPNIPDKFLSFFVRGYFDGDGCVNISKGQYRLNLVFTSGSPHFLNTLGERVANCLLIKHHRAVRSTGSYQLRYSTREAIQILDYMYKDLDLSPYLKRKYTIYQKWRGTQVAKGTVCKTVIRGFNSHPRLK